MNKIALIAILTVLAVVLSIALFIGAIVVLIVNIIDINNVGPNFWNVFWIALSSFYLLTVGTSQIAGKV